MVGYSRGPAGTRAFVWTAQSGMQSLGALPGGRYSHAVGINETGEIVGVSASSQGTRAVIWNLKGEPQDLNALVSAPSGVILSMATGINARGQIVTVGRDERDPHGNHEGPSRAFLLTPN